MLISSISSFLHCFLRLFSLFVLLHLFIYLDLFPYTVDKYYAAPIAALNPSSSSLPLPQLAVISKTNTNITAPPHVFITARLLPPPAPPPTAPLQLTISQRGSSHPRPLGITISCHPSNNFNTATPPHVSITTHPLPPAASPAAASPLTLSHPDTARGADLLV